MKFSIYQTSHQGGRKYNQDCVAHAYTNESLLLVLADGMGGHSHGELAAEITIKAFMHAFSEEAKPVLDNPAEFINRVMRKAHDSIIQFAHDQKLLGNPGTTCVAAVIQDGKLCWGHAGDSRLYLLRENKVLAVTHDHSIVQQWADMGYITEEEMKTHPDRHRITNCLGGEGELFYVAPSPEVTLQDGDVVLVCSDGLWGPQSHEEISHALQEKPLLTALEDLVAVSLYREGAYADNATAVVVRYGSAEEEHNSEDPEFDMLLPH